MTVTLTMRDVSGPDGDQVPEAEREIVKALTITMDAATRELPGGVTLSALVSIILTLTAQFPEPDVVWGTVQKHVATGLANKKRQEN